MKKLPRKSKAPLSARCDYCGAKPSVIIDAPTRCGSWALMCKPCFQLNGIEGQGTTHENFNSEALARSE